MPSRKKKIAFPDLGKLRREGALLYVYQNPIPEEYRDEHPPTARWIFFHYFGTDDKFGDLTGGEIVDLYDLKHCVSRFVRRVAQGIEKAEWMSHNSKRWENHWVKKFGLKK